MRLELLPRFEYGLTVPHFRISDGGVIALAGADEVHLRSGVRIDVGEGQAEAEFSVGTGTRHGFVLQHRAAFGRDLEDLPSAQRLLDETIAGWTSWAADHDSYQGPDRDLVRQGALVLQGLTYQPSGGVIAAATTSLPEIIGGSANWDYRFVWLRDLSLTMRALWVAACPSEVERHLELIWRALGDEREAPVQIMVGINGERDLSEHELGHLVADFHSVGINVDPNENASDLAEYADGEGFDWRFVKADAELRQLLTDRYGFGVTNPPSTPTFIVSDGSIRALGFGRVRSAEELVAELGAG